MNEAIISFLATALALAAVLVLAYFILKGGARFTRRHQHSGMTHVLEVTPLGGRDRLVTVNHKDKQLLIGISSSRITLLHSEPAPDNSAK